MLFVKQDRMEDAWNGKARDGVQHTRQSLRQADRMTATHPTEEQQAAALVSGCLQEPVQSVMPIVGKGIVNRVFIVRTAQAEVVVRMREDALSDYRKERWCLEQAAARGVPGPSVLALGEAETVAYLLQSRVPGENGEDRPDAAEHLWREIGRYARAIETIPVTGFGEELTDPERGVFGDSHVSAWRDFVTYNIESLTDTDPLLQLNVLTRAQSSQARRLFEEIRDREFSIGLHHGDLSLKNTHLAADGTVYLLDWGSAAADLSPQAALMNVLKSHLLTNDPDAAGFRAFLAGYGLSPSAFEAMRPELDTLLLLRAFDLVRYALDRSPEDIVLYAEQARQMLRRKLASA